MNYRVLGRTGLKISELGFGGHEFRRWLPGKRDMEKFMREQPERNRLIRRAIEAGINYFDTGNLEEAESLGLALKEEGRRDDIHLTIMILGLFGKMAEKPRSQWKDLIMDDAEMKLKALNTKYADILTLLAPESNYSRERLTATLEVLRELKNEGRIGFIGASTHQPKFLAEVLRRYDCFDMAMVRYNYHLQEARDALFPLAKALEVGIVVMKPFAWPYYGIPFMRFGPMDGEEGFYTPAQTCIRWILGSPEVATIVPGMNTPAELEENLDAITRKGEADERVLERYLEAAKGCQAREKLKKMLHDPAADIRHYAKIALANQT